MKLRRLLITATFGIASTAGLVASSVGTAHATTLGKPSVTFGCGTVTVTDGGISETLQILPCPGPVI